MKKKLTIAAIWLVLGYLGALAFKSYVLPSWEKAKKEEVLDKTSADSRYQHEINVAHDTFSGYCVLRSEVMRSELGHKGIKCNLELVPDYEKRLRDLVDGKLHIGTFTVDALLKNSAILVSQGKELVDLPVVIAVIDETRGADAIVAYQKVAPNIDSLNDPEMKFVLSKDTPSETLLRVVASHFALSALKNISDSIIPVEDASIVYDKYRKNNHQEKIAYVLWEPYVTKALENPNIHVVVDSSKFRGYIVDVFVVNRDFLAKRPEVVQGFLESYFRANYHYRDSMKELVRSDAVQIGQPLSEEQATRIVNGIWWKNTLENYAHFGVSKDSLQHMEDMITNISNVLVSTRAIVSDPTGGHPERIYFGTPLEKMHSENFHPGNESLKDDKVILEELTEEQWKSLKPLGTFSVEQLVFVRGQSELSEVSFRILDELAEKLKTWPLAYVEIQGDSNKIGDIEANKALAQSRAESALLYLVSKGIDKKRMRAISRNPSGTTTVRFSLGVSPY